MERPVIGICTALEQARWGVWDQSAFLLPESYVIALHRAGAIAIMLPPDPAVSAAPDQVLDLVDGLLLAGGADIDPDSYGETTRHARTVGTVPARDAFEIAMVRRAIDRDVPVLGICRGMQLLNVARGGSVIQDLPEHFGHSDHMRTPGTFDGNDHFVRLTPGTLAAAAAGTDRPTAKSHHHQGIDRLGDGLVVSGWAEGDDLPEAIEDPTRRFALGVQWHPEADARSQLVGALVLAARRARDARTPTGKATDRPATDQPATDQPATDPLAAAS
ncbi:MAG TPA: gamma-glutamyl-gamma-aminobutyrate hydrolase family protein [Solirubrobacteraceae bacterium]|nr:gamma-glutamyl-gamma-aminobutyrate hydrolase family protein [Solirubrobacteraceae bacterium]